MQNDLSNRLPVTVLTGFLGAGAKDLYFMVTNWLPKFCQF